MHRHVANQRQHVTDMPRTPHFRNLSSPGSDLYSNAYHIEMIVRIRPLGSWRCHVRRVCLQPVEVVTITAQTRLSSCLVIDEPVSE